MWKIKNADGTISYPNGKLFKSIKLGNVVASVAQPIAGTIDNVLGTNIKGCGACAKRQEALNNMFLSKLDT